GTTAGVDGARCLAGTLGGAGVCPEALPQSLRRFVDKRVHRAERLLSIFEKKRNAGAKERALDRVLGALDRVFAGIGARAEHAAGSGKTSRRISEACVKIVGQLVARERDVLARLQ